MAAPAATPEQFSVHDAASVAARVEAAYGISAADFSTLHAASISARGTAYCPYSRFRVGAAILTSSGAVVTGANVENASYPVGICAERTAFSKAVTEGHFKGHHHWPGQTGESEGKGKAQEGEHGEPKGLRSFRALAVVTDVAPPCSPCGMCRQFIREFCDLEMPVFMFDKDDNCIVKKLQELLPMSFGPEALPPPSSLPG